MKKTHCTTCHDTGWVTRPATMTVQAAMDRLQGPTDEEAVEELDVAVRQGCPHCRADAERRGRRVGGVG